MPFDDLPDDNFNVIVANDMDRLRLLWLVNRIGEDKLGKSVAKDIARWPGKQPFVSTMLNRFNLKVPVEVYAPVRISVYWLYFLWLVDGSKVKIGITGRWPLRALSFVKLRRQVPEVFDVDRSIAFLVGGSKVEALRREGEIKSKFATCRVDSPWLDGVVPYGCGGHKEWFDGAIESNLLEFASAFDGTSRVIQSLRVGLEFLEADRAAGTGDFVLPSTEARTSQIAED